MSTSTAVEHLQTRLQMATDDLTDKDRSLQAALLDLQQVCQPSATDDMLARSSDSIDTPRHCTLVRQ